MSKEPYILKVEGQHLVPADQWTAERLDGFKNGSVVKADKLVFPRSLPFQGYYWVVLTKIVDATGVAPTAEHLHKSLLKLCKYCSPVINTRGEIIDWAVDSTRFESMDQDDFEKYVEHAKQALAEHILIVWDDYDKKTPRVIEHAQTPRV